MTGIGTQISAFFLNVILRWQALVTGGIITALFAVYEKLARKQVARKTYVWFFIVIAFLCSCFLAWHDEHHNTEVVMSEKSALASELNTCTARLNGQNILTEQWNGRYLDAQKVINSMQTPVAQQQATINSCVLSLGKLNPIVNSKFAVLDVVSASTKGGWNGKAFIPSQIFSVMIITTNRVANPTGDLKCEKAFQITDTPNLPVVQGSIMVTKNPSPIALSDHEYELRLSTIGHEWGPVSPITFPVQSEFENLGKCTFTLL